MPIIQGSLTSLHGARPPEPVVNVVVAHGNNTISIMALLDTGAQQTVVPFDLAIALGLDIARMAKVERHSICGTKTVYIGGVDIALSGHSFGRRMVDFALDWEMPIVGYDILRSGRLEVDYGNQTFAFAF